MLISFSLPKNFYFPPGVKYATRLVRFNGEEVGEEEEGTERERTTRGRSRGNPRGSEKEKEKEQRVDSREDKGKKRDFLAITHGTEVVVRNHKQETSDN